VIFFKCLNIISIKLMECFKETMGLIKGIVGY